jgi:hypothetical protein
MNDVELRGKLLKVFYDRRHNAQGWVPTSEMEFSGEEMIDRQMIGTIGRQLAEVGLIKWKPLVGAQEGFVVAMAQITALGVDVVEGSAQPPIGIALSPARTQPPAPVTEPPATGTAAREETEIFSLKPALYGVGVDLKALYRYLQKKFRN